MTGESSTEGTGREDLTSEQTSAFGRVCFGVCCFFGRNYENDDRSRSIRLPLAYSTLSIIGRFPFLKRLDHPHLCSYLDIQRGKYDMLYVVSEHYCTTVSSLMTLDYMERKVLIPQISFEILSGLNYLHQHGVVDSFLCPENVLLDAKGCVKLSHFGLYYLSDAGQNVTFTIGDPFYSAPEMYGNASEVLRSRKCDVWSFALIVFELILGCRILEKDRHCFTGASVAKWMQIVLKASAHKSVPIAILEATGEDMRKLKECPKIESMLERCLVLFPSQRFSCEDLLKLDVFKDCIKRPWEQKIENVFLRPSARGTCLFSTYDEHVLDSPLSSRPLEEIYFLWKLVGGTPESYLEKCGLTKLRQSILAVPSFLTEETDIFGRISDAYRPLLKIEPLKMSNLIKKVQSVNKLMFFMCMESEVLRDSYSSYATLKDDTSALVKEKDVLYQLWRMIIFHRYLEAYPYKQEKLLEEARLDVPPVYRGLIWTVLLSLQPYVRETYAKIDKTVSIAADRQIEVDIPRCHQYDELLSSPEGHSKFKRILKAWLIANPQYVYWQGLDSLCAPFLYLNFSDESIAFGCLSAFVERYLWNFFLKDNSAVMQEYLAVFNHLIAFCDPELHSHLVTMGFTPELFGISWFLTTFAHVLPLSKLFHVWDVLLLAGSSFPLVIGVAILRCLRDTLLNSGFNECILLFSDLPEMNIEECLKEARILYRAIPKSATYRRFMYEASPGYKKDVHQDILGSGYEFPENSSLGISEISIETLKSEVVPRICADELMYCSDQYRQQSNSAHQVVIVDIRETEEFSKGAIAGSLNVPYSSLFDDGRFSLQRSLSTALNDSYDLLVLVGTARDQRAHKVAVELVHLNYAKVVILDGGIDVLRQTGFLAVT